ncbi:MAG: sugar porter family MFS transporter [Deltaproteobacteria bacterium]|nr:sugar porter family MFS transporter [Deltaproteobacteria bacterium]
MNKKLLLATLVSALGGFLFGFDTVVISGTNEFLQQHFELGPLSLGVTVSIALWGTVIGSLAIGKPGDRYGRRSMLFLCALLFLGSAAGCALAPTWPLLLGFRFLGGIGIGATSVMSPLYIAEISPARLRGRLVAVAQFNIVLGIVVAFFSNYLVAGHFGAETIGVNWRWMLGVMIVPSALFFLLLFLVPESPRWLVKHGLVDRAEKVLEMIGSSDVRGELSAIAESVRRKSGDGETSLFQRKYGYAILCAVLLAGFNQLTGINAILYYAPTIFREAGASIDLAMLQALSVGATNMLFTVIAMFFIDKLGRKTLLLVGAVGMFLSLLGAGVHGLVGFPRGTGMVFFVIGFIAFFAFSQGAVIWVFLAEIFPNKVRARGQALGSFVHWIMNAIIGLVFPVAFSAFGIGPIFLFFALMMIPFFLFVWRMMPETKGISLEELEKKIVHGGV